MKRILGFVLPLCAALTLSSCDKNEHYINDVVSYPESLVFDMGFDEVGRGYDRTGNLDVSTMTGAQLYATYNRHFEQYSSIFNTKAGLDNFESGYYRASYKGCEAFKKALGDGFSVELMFSPGQVENSVVMSARGFSVEILETEKDGKKGWNMKFTVKVDGKLYSTTTALYEDDSIKTGTYYHVVAVWNILAAQTRIYVNNVGSTVCKNVAGTLDMGDELCIGSSYSSSRKVGQAFNGEIVWARIYDKSFYAEDVKQMFYTALYTGNEQQLSISDILYRTPCKVAPGNRYYVYGKGFEEGDSIAFRSSGAEEFRCCAEPHEFYNGVSVVLPEDLQSGVYEMTAFRGDVVKPLGIVSFELSETPDFGVKTKILAHRCAHDGESIPENSVAALKNAQDLGLWGAEFDLWITSPDEGVDNGVVVVNHDGKVSDKVLQNVKYSDLAGVTLSNGEPVATFESFLEQGKKTSIHLQFEIKEHSSPEAMNRCADEVVRLVEKYDYAPENFTITSNNYDVLKYLRDKEGIGATLRLAWQKPKSPEELEDLSMNSLSFGMMYYSLNPLWSARAEEMGMTSTAWLMPASEEDIVTAIGLGIGSITIEGKSDIERAKKLIERYVWLSEE